jgi:hypothetical protein
MAPVTWSGISCRICPSPARLAYARTSTWNISDATPEKIVDHGGEIDTAPYPEGDL